MSGVKSLQRSVSGMRTLRTSPEVRLLRFIPRPNSSRRVRFGLLQQGCAQLRSAPARTRAQRLASTLILISSALLPTCLAGCHLAKDPAAPSIQLTRIPPAIEGGPDTLDIVEGRVTGAAPGQQVILYARNTTWWLQPLVSQPFTQLRGDGSWTNSTHVGTEYAALLVDPGYHPATNLTDLPSTGNGVAAVAFAKGSAPGTVSKMISFSGYDWRLRTVPSDRGGRSPYDPANASVDSIGALHLRISRKGDDWSCVEVSLNRSFGYGTYAVSVRDTWHLEPAAVFSAFTFDYAGGAKNNREMGIETSRWGDAGSQNAQFVVQPFFVPANAARFLAPPGPLTHSMRWEPGRVSFRTVRGLHADEKARPVAEHVFTSGVPSPGTETMRMTLYVFRSANLPLQHENEVVVEKFAYLP